MFKFIIIGLDGLHFLYIKYSLYLYIYYSWIYVRMELESDQYMNDFLKVSRERS